MAPVSVDDEVVDVDGLAITYIRPDYGTFIE